MKEKSVFWIWLRFDIKLETISQSFRLLVNTIKFFIIICYFCIVKSCRNIREIYMKRAPLLMVEGGSGLVAWAVLVEHRLYIVHWTVNKAKNQICRPIGRFCACPKYSNLNHFFWGGGLCIDFRKQHCFFFCFISYVHVDKKRISLLMDPAFALNCQCHKKKTKIYR